MLLTEPSVGPHSFAASAMAAQVPRGGNAAFGTAGGPPLHVAGAVPRVRGPPLNVATSADIREASGPPGKLSAFTASARALLEQRRAKNASAAVPNALVGNAVQRPESSTGAATKDSTSTSSVACQGNFVQQLAGRVGAAATCPLDSICSAAPSQRDVNSAAALPPAPCQMGSAFDFDEYAFQVCDRSTACSDDWQRSRQLAEVAKQQETAAAGARQFAELIRQQEMDRQARPLACAAEVSRSAETGEPHSKQRKEDDAPAIPVPLPIFPAARSRSGDTTGSTTPGAVGNAGRWREAAQALRGRGAHVPSRRLELEECQKAMDAPSLSFDFLQANPSSVDESDEYGLEVEAPAHVDVRKAWISSLQTRIATDAVSKMVKQKEHREKQRQDKDQRQRDRTGGAEAAGESTGAAGAAGADAAPSVVEVGNPLAEEA